VIDQEAYLNIETVKENYKEFFLKGTINISRAFPGLAFLTVIYLILKDWKDWLKDFI
jgi:hypothetical protein